MGILKLKKKIHCNKAFLKDADTEKVLVPNKICFGEKNCNYFIGYLYDNHEVKPLHITLSKISAYVKSFDGQTKWMYFLTKDNDLLKTITLFGLKI